MYDDYGAIHGAWCGARTFPTTCRYCGEKVFYFSCNCGCKVFFDRLGWPWPKHDCQSPEAIVRAVDIQVEREYVERMAKRYEKRREWEPPICVCHPKEGEEIFDLGLVREYAHVDIYKKYKIEPDLPLAVKFLGELARNDYFQVTAHANDLESEQLQSYTFLVKQSKWKSAGAILGDLVEFSLVGFAIPGRESVGWLCKDIHRL
jgi:hypothetical protein